MIVDTSALLAILQNEESADAAVATLIASVPRIAATTLVEARVVVGARYGVVGLRRLEALIRQFEIEVDAFDERHADAAALAYREFGKGSGHSAQLNLGDTFSYALASVEDEPLLYVGDDFSHTDIRSALEEYGED